AACAAHRKCRTDDERVAHLADEITGLIYSVDDIRFRHRNFHLIHERPEQIAVLRLFDGIQSCTEQLDAVLLENTEPVKLNSHVQTDLAAECRQERIRLLLADDPG